MRSQSAFVFFLNRGAISWKSSKQVTVVEFTPEAELAASAVAQEAI